MSQKSQEQLADPLKQIHSTSEMATLFILGKLSENPKKIPNITLQIIYFYIY